MIDYDDIEFPYTGTKQNICENWYDFNDSAVSVIPVNRL